MPSSSQIAVYVAGTRLSQALIISNLDSSVFSSARPLLAAIERLRRDFVEFVENVAIEQRMQSHAQDLLEQCWSEAISLSPEAVRDNDGFGACNSYLEAFKEVLSSRLLNDAENDRSLIDWFNLGLMLPDGTWDDPFYPSYPQVRRREGNARWVFHQQTNVQRTLRKLRIPLKRLMPLSRSRTVIEFVEVPTEFCCWEQLEAGIDKLLRRRNEGRNRAGALADQVSSKTTFVPTHLQRQILDALNGRGLRKDLLAAEVCAGDAPRLYKPGGLKELKDLGLVENKRGVGYYRTDAPPPNSISIRKTKPPPN